jgi:hypothetical protein
LRLEAVARSTVVAGFDISSGGPDTDRSLREPHLRYVDGWG